MTHRSDQLAHHAITSVATLLSVRSRMKLTNLAAALETRSHPDFTELARRARLVVTNT